VDIAGRSSAVFSLIDVRGSAVQAGSPGGLADVPVQTGGRFVTGASPSSALAEALQDQLGYYLVSYETGEASNDLLSGRPLQQYPVLRSTRAGVQLLARRGLLNSENFVSAPGRTDVWRPSFTTPASDLVRGFTHPFASGGIPIQFAAVYSVGKTGPQVEGRLHIDANNLTFTRRLDGRTTGSIDIQMAAVDENGRATQNTSGVYDLQLTPDQYQEGLKVGFGGGPKLSIRTPGAYQVRVAVRDGTSGKIGSASQFLDVPDPSAGKFAITSIDLMNPKDMGVGQTALRVLAPGAAFRYSYQVANLLAEAGKGSRMDELTRILHDGTPIFESKPTHWDFTPVENSKLRTADGSITLGSGIKPGYYVLQIIATDTLAKEPRTATEYLRFEVK
jgi:hypothetical protein